MFKCLKLLHSVIIWIPILWRNLMHLIALYSYNINVILKMTGLSAETYRWKYNNKNTSVELNEFFRFLIHITQINAQNMDHVKKKFCHFKMYAAMLLWCFSASLFSLQVADNRNNQRLGEVLWIFLPSLFARPIWYSEIKCFWCCQNTANMKHRIMFRTLLEEERACCW